MSARSEPVQVTAGLLRSWALPRPGDDKEDRGQVLVVGGAAQTPGAVILAATAALRSGAGKLQVATVESTAVAVAAAVPEAFVEGLPQTASGALSGDGAQRLVELATEARALLVGPGITDADACSVLLDAVLPALPASTTVVLDAYALAYVGSHPTCLQRFGGNAVLTPNVKEMALMAGLDQDEVERDPGAAARDGAARFGAVVSVGSAQSWVAAPDGTLWCDSAGGPGLAASGSGDAMAGVVVGLAARGASAAQAAVWAAHLHGRAGDRLAASTGRLGYLARETVDEVPRVLTEIES
ncbi:MAG: ADP-dependent NAD(P)H-hydrate dehydratase [Frankiales bacterium]|jgi:ADP-dependent NAD(P)H-hydrate dehydratase|nr:ADP-dependent NAD(P)H-hydrate dehydratase [Frankiales bacterium]